jgi:hypothetical protein
MSWKVLLGLAGLVAILVVIAEGISAGVLNLVPVALVFGWAAVVQWEHGPGKAAAPVVAIPALAVFAFVAFIAIGWRWGEASSGSTAVLLLLFAPIWAVGIGAATATCVALLHPHPRGRGGAEQASICSELRGETDSPPDDAGRGSG